jgi:hypothetical protein
MYVESYDFSFFHYCPLRAVGSAHAQISLKIMGTSVSFQFRNEQFCARSRTIPQDSGIGSAAGRPSRARSTDKLSVADHGRRK